MPLRYPDDMVGRRNEWDHLCDFLNSGLEGASLGIVWGRRRVGKSFLLESATEQTGGLYYPATRGSRVEALRELGARIGTLQGASAPLALQSWDEVMDALLALGRERETTVVLDEYPYLLEHTPELDSVIQRAFGPRQSGRLASRTRLVLCGSAMSIMAKLLTGTAPLRGRAGLDLRVSPFDFRVARALHGIEELATAFRTYAVIGGVAAYARVMSEDDVPTGPADFDRWVCRRVLSPAAPLFGEVDLLLSEDPVTAKARKLNLYHATLAGVASGHRAHATLTSHVKISGASLTPILDGLASAELITRLQDPLRDNRPTYHPGDPLLRFHYAIIRRHRDRFARHAADTAALWSSILPTFGSQVLGPCFEDAARYWTMHFADANSVGGPADFVGTTTITLDNGHERELDVVVAAADADTPGERTVRAIGEAKAGERITAAHVRRLEEARTALAERGRDAKLLLFGADISPEVRREAARREDLEVVDLPRLYGGA